jgi:hypothetical protein
MKGSYRTNRYLFPRHTTSCELSLFRHPTFTRDIDVLPEGHRLANRNAYCGLGYRGSMTCRTGEHGFAIATIWGENW